MAARERKVRPLKYIKEKAPEAETSERDRGRKRDRDSPAQGERSPSAAKEPSEAWPQQSQPGWTEVMSRTRASAPPSKRTYIPRKIAPRSNAADTEDTEL